MTQAPSYDHLPIHTDTKAAEWANRLAVLIAGDTPEPSFDLDLVERMVQAIRNEAAREVYVTVSNDALASAFNPQIWGENHAG